MFKPNNIKPWDISLHNAKSSDINKEVKEIITTVGDIASDLTFCNRSKAIRIPINLIVIFLTIISSILVKITAHNLIQKCEKVKNLKLNISVLPSASPQGTIWCQCYKTFLLLTYDWPKQARVFGPASFLI